MRHASASVRLCILNENANMIAEIFNMDQSSTNPVTNQNFYSKSHTPMFTKTCLLR